MNPIVRAILHKELTNANDDLARAELEVKRTRGQEPDSSNLYDYINGKRAKIRALLEEIGPETV